MDQSGLYKWVEDDGAASQYVRRELLVKGKKKKPVTGGDSGHDKPYSNAWLDGMVSRSRTDPSKRGHPWFTRQEPDVCRIPNVG
jgi:hypothetical protein